MGIATIINDIENYIDENKTGHQCVDELTPIEKVDFWLNWNGMIGYTGKIVQLFEWAGWRSPLIEPAQTELIRQMRERAKFVGTSASLSRLLQSWADVIDGKPDVGWATMCRRDIELEKQDV